MRLGVVCGILGLGSSALAQDPPPAPAETLPIPPSPNAVPPAAGATKEQLEDRVRQLEAMVEKLSGQMSGMTPPAAGAPAATGDPSASDGGGAAGAAAGARAGSGDSGSKGSDVTPSASGGPSAPGQSLPPNPSASARFNSPSTLENKHATVKFGPGFEIRTDDEEFIFQFHNLTQFDYRGYLQGGQSSVKDTFAFPRQWFMFSGRISKPFGYFVSIANGFDTLSLLDVFVDVSYDPRLQFRLGRYKTPFTYEFLVEPIQGLAVPERSVFFNNFAQNRDLGVMAYGRLFDKKFDYAVGIFNGTRNGFLAQQDGKAVSGFINYKPFGDEENTLLENLNIGGSVFALHSDQIALPQTLRTIVPTTGNAIIGTPFLGLNNNVREHGQKAFWDLHAAYYYGGLSVISEWGSGVQDYALASNLNNPTRIGVQSFYTQASYLITGETRSSMGIVKPLRPFDLRKGHIGPGAWEPFVRYEYMDVDNKVFSAGFADKNNWTNRLDNIWVGVNWHLTQYAKMYFGWNHSDFGDPVLFAPNRRQSTSDMFLVRFQLYF